MPAPIPTQLPTADDRLPVQVESPSPAPELDQSKDVSKAGRILLRIRVFRPLNSPETIVEMQSDFDFRPLFSESDDPGACRTLMFGGVRCRFSKAFSLPSGRGLLFNSDKWQAAGNVNFAFFMADNLATGVKFKFPNKPLSIEGARSFMSEMRETAREVLSAYLRPIDEGYRVMVQVEPVAQRE